MTLQDIYETEFGIYNHLANNNRRPLASVALHPCEDFNKDSLLKEAIDNFVSSNVRDSTGLNLLEFLSLPMDIVAMISTSCNELSKKKADQLAEAKLKAEQTAGK